MNPQMIDIVFLAVIAILLIYRLSKILGSKPDEGENKPVTHDAEIVDITPQKLQKSDILPADEKTEIKDPLKAVFFKMYSLDKTFHPAKFLEGAKAAFEMIVDAFAKGDEETLKSLVSDSVFKKFHTAIMNFIKQKQRIEQTLIGFTDVKIINAEIEGTQALITVEFTTEQSKAVFDDEGKVIEGDAALINTVIDKWTFTRDLKSSSPNWFLTAVKSGAS